jgi:S1-C subfamily serine protease
VLSHLARASDFCHKFMMHRLIPIFLIVVALLAPVTLRAQSIPNLSNLDFETKSSIEIACAYQRTLGPAKYASCINQQLASLRGSAGIPNLSNLDFETKSSIEIACAYQRTLGPAKYASCINQQLASIGKAPIQKQKRRYVTPPSIVRKSAPPKENYREQLDELRRENDRLRQSRKSEPKVVKKAEPEIDHQQRLDLARRTQEALQVLGLYSGKLDGIIGVRTKSAVRRWQGHNGYPRTGELNRTQLAKLEQEAIARLAEKKPEPRTASKKRPSPKTSTSGSGFFVSKLGHIVTNQHVVNSCSTVTVGDNANSQVKAEVVGSDRRNDLALLKISSTEMASAETKSLIRKLSSGLTQNLDLKVVPLSSNGLLRSDDVELGEGLLVAGYPYGEVFSNTIKVTKGIVSAIRGIGDDTGQFQLDAAVQPGNSGGPIYDENGNIVGVVVAQLDKLKMAKTIGSMPENVNFGIKASTVRQFLTSSGLPTKWSSRAKSMSTKELAKIARNQTVMVVCSR